MKTGFINIMTPLFVLRRTKATDKEWIFSIYDRHTDQRLGAVNLHNIDWENGFFEIGFGLRPSARGQGIMTSAVDALVEFCFTHLGAKILEIKPTNEKAQKVAERLGFEKRKRGLIPPSFSFVLTQERRLQTAMGPACTQHPHGCRR